MAYTTPSTWVAGNVLTAAQLNQQLRDNLNAAFPLEVGVWTTWVPTLTNITLGNGTVVARYTKVGRTVHYRWIFTMGSTSAMGTNPQFTPPETLAGYTADAEPIGDGQANDITGSRFRTQVWMVTTTNLRIIHWDAASTAQNITATIPFTWATGDVLVVTGFFQTAA